MKKVLLVATVQSHIAQFHRPLIRVLKEQGYEIHVAARNNLNEKNGLSIRGVDTIFDVPFHRSPFHPRNIKAYMKLAKIINSGAYDMISCNTPVGGILTRIAARKTRKKGTRVIYTAHGFHFYKGASKKNWLLYYPLEKIMARMTDTLITISEEDYALAKCRFATDVQHIHGVGVDTMKFTDVAHERIQAAKEEFATKDRFVVLCVGELNANKNQSTVIRAFRKVADKYPQVLLLLAGNGPKENDLCALIEELQLQDNVKMIGYRTDLEVFTNLCDVVVSFSFREGLGMNLLEAMLCGKPAVASHNRGHDELISDGENGFLISATDCDALAEKLETLIADKELYAAMAARNRVAHTEYYASSVERELEEIYLSKVETAACV